MRAVYSPCVDTLEYMFASRQRKLPPKELVVLEDNEARYLVDKFGRFGVRFLKTKKKGDKAVADEVAFKEAGEAWEKGNREWAEETVTDFHKSTKDQREAGVKVVEPKRVQVAKKVLKIAVVALALLLPAASWAQDAHKAANFTYKYDVASATITYCATSGASGDPYGLFIQGPGSVETSGDVVTVTGVVAAEDVFAQVSVGDMFSVRLSNGSVENRVVVTNADDDTITVDTSINLTTPTIWNYKTLACGTTANDGWISVEGYSTVQLGFQYDAGDVTAAATTMECRSGAIGAAPVRVYPGVASDCGDGTLNGTVCEFTSVGDAITFKVANNGFSACRIGVAWVTADGGTRDELTVTIDVKSGR